MASSTRKLLIAGGVAAAAVAGEKALARHVRQRFDPATDHLLEPPPDVRHLTVGTTDGGSLHLIERGEGRPVLLIHGITLNAELWSPQLHQLSDEFRVIALDQRGHGDSKAGERRYSMTELGGDIASVLTELDLRDALVVGHSMGGMATLNFAVDHPDVRRERVGGIGLVATAAARPFHPVLTPRLTALGALAVERLDSGLPVPSVRFTGNDLSLFLCRTAFGQAPSAKAIEQVRASIEATDEEVIVRCMAGIADHDTTARLGGVDTPAFVVVGARDLLTPVPFARTMAEALPDAELTILPRAGHQLMQERPGEIGGLIRDLAERTRTPAPV